LITRADGKTVLVIPSLINRHYILDLLSERSFVRFLRAAGLRPLVIDWGEPGEPSANSASTIISPAGSTGC